MAKKPSKTENADEYRIRELPGKFVVEAMREGNAAQGWSFESEAKAKAFIKKNQGE